MPGQNKKLKKQTKKQKKQVGAVVSALLFVSSTADSDVGGALLEVGEQGTGTFFLHFSICFKCSSCRALKAESSMMVP